jgi:H+/gluconate symporter-like permease
VKIWTVSTLFVFVAYVLMNVLSDKLASAMKVQDGLQVLLPLILGMSFTAQVVVWPARYFAHPYTEDWVVALLVVACCIGWALPLAYTVFRLTGRSNRPPTAAADLRR